MAHKLSEFLGEINEAEVFFIRDTLNIPGDLDNYIPHNVDDDKTKLDLRCNDGSHGFFVAREKKGDSYIDLIAERREYFTEMGAKISVSFQEFSRKLAGFRWEAQLI